MTTNPVPSSGNWGAMYQAGSSLTGPVIVGVGLDFAFGWLPWATIIGVFLGLFVCMWSLYRLMKQSDTNTPDKPLSSS